MKKTEEFLNRWKLKLMAVGVLIALSLVVVLAGFRFYSRYREQVIRTEESQLLTMAGIVGNNLDSYLEQQLDEIDLFYSQRGIPEEWAESNGIKLRTSYFLKKNADIYNWITVTEQDGTRFKYESGKEAVQESSAEKTMSVAPGNKDQKARITGKEISDRTGWYELYIEKEVPSDVRNLYPYICHGSGSAVREDRRAGKDRRGRIFQRQRSEHEHHHASCEESDRSGGS